MNKELVEALSDRIVKHVNERGRVLNPQLSDKVYKKYRRTLDKLVTSIGEEFQLHPSVVAIVLESVVRKFFGTQFRPGTERKYKNTDFEESVQETKKQGK